MPAEVKGRREDFVQLYKQKEMQQVELIDRILSEENIKAAIHADEHPMTASGGNIIGCEIRRNKQSPHEAELRRLSLRTGATKVRRASTRCR